MTNTQNEPVEVTQADQIKHMVTRFLGWRLPENFSPDAGISFKPTFNDHLPEPMRHEPVGTNLFDYTQAEQMVRYMLEGLPRPASSAAMEYFDLWQGAQRRADRWRGIAAAMGYEPDAHDKVKPTEQWLIDRIAKYRAEAALANTPKPNAGLVEELRLYPDWLSTLNNIVRALEDEGDRVYLGSTNDADDLRDIARTLNTLSYKSALEGDRP